MATVFVKWPMAEEEEKKPLVAGKTQAYQSKKP